MIKRIPVKTVKMIMVCDACGVEMIRTSYYRDEQHVYRCPRCKARIVDTELYPEIAYIEEELESAEEATPQAESDFRE